MLDPNSEITRELKMLDHIADDPDINQATLADKLGVAVGTVNWHLKRMVQKGYVKAKRAQRKKLRYILTPEGIALRTRLTVDFIEQSFQTYRLIRNRVTSQIQQLRARGYNAVTIQAGHGDIADICRLTCMEQGIEVVDRKDVPQLIVQGMNVSVKYNQSIEVPAVEG